MHNTIENISISGYKSIRNLENLQFSQLNVLVGANGSGKSNLISFFEMLNSIAKLSLGSYVSHKGGADVLLHSGSETAEQISCEIQFESNEDSARTYCYGYKMSLNQSETNTLYFNDEYAFCQSNNMASAPTDWRKMNNSSTESRLYHDESSVKVLSTMNAWRLFHFHDTSFRAKMKMPSDVNDGLFLKANGENIASFLFQLERDFNTVYLQICDTVRLVAPFFTRFEFEPDHKNRVILKWRDEYGNIMMPSQFSDGTLRFICLVSLLLQPYDANFICMDEPELGLHPYAVEILAALIKERSFKSQLLISTQSPTLLDFFEPDDIIVSERQNGESVFKRLDNNSLKYWMEEFTTSEAWRSNAFGGVPTI